MEVPAKQPYLLTYIILVYSLPRWISEIPWNAKPSLSHFYVVKQKNIFL